MIRPLFNPDDIVNQIVVKLDGNNVVQRLNKELQEWERNPDSQALGPRLAKRKGTYLADDCYGLLVTDMTPSKVLVRIESTSTDIKRNLRTRASRIQAEMATSITFCAQKLKTLSHLCTYRASERRTRSGRRTFAEHLLSFGSSIF